MQDVPAFDEGDYIGGLDGVLGVDCVGAGSNTCAAHRTTRGKGGKHVCNRISDAQLLRVSLTERLGGVPVALARISDTDLIDKARANRPHIGKLDVVAVDIEG